MKTKVRKNRVLGAELLALAEGAPPVVRLKDFLPAVDALRAKGYSWRACAEWLNHNAALEVDHTSLMRISANREVLESAEE